MIFGDGLHHLRADTDDLHLYIAVHQHNDQDKLDQGGAQGRLAFLWFDARANV